MSEYLVESSTNGRCTGAVPDGAASVDSSGGYHRKFLEPWVGSSVVVTGSFRAVRFEINWGRDYPNVLLRDVEVELPDRSRHSLGHLHVSDAEPLTHALLRSRLRLRCRVRKYANNHGHEEDRYGVRYLQLLAALSVPTCLSPALRKENNRG
jgi:hypothetical protein